MTVRILELSATPATPPRKKSLRAIQKQETLQLLLKSASHLFIRKGYAGTTIEDIASRAGASRATFYLHFGRKWHVLRDLMEATVLAEALDFYRRIDAIENLSREDLKAWLLDALDFSERHKKLITVHRQALSIEPEMERHNMLFLRRCIDAMPNYLKRWGPERETYAKLRLDMLIPQLDDAARWLINDSSTLSKELVVEALLEYWLVGLSPPDQP